MTTFAAAITLTASLALAKVLGLADPVRDLAAWCVAVGTILGFIALVGRSKPGRWLGRTLVGRPVSEWLHKTVTNANAPRFDAQDEILVKVQSDTAECRKELRLNGSNKSAITHLTDRLDAAQAELHGSLTAGFLEAAQERVRLGARLDEVAEITSAAASDARQAQLDAQGAAAESRLAHAAAKHNEVTNAAVAEKLEAHLSSSAEYGGMFVEAGRQIIAQQDVFSRRLDEIERKTADLPESA